jgi:hypothetical protein
MVEEDNVKGGLWIVTKRAVCSNFCGKTNLPNAARTRERGTDFQYPE